MRVLVTGGAGFIGSALIRHLIQHTAWDVLNFDKLTYAGNLESLTTCIGSPRYRFVRGDIIDAATVSNALNEFQPDAIMHLAAESHVDRSIEGPAAFIGTNIVGTYTLLEAVRRYWQSLAPERQAAFRFHHISTDEVYGDLGDSSLDGSAALFSESTAYAPSSPYAASKASADHLVRAWQRTYGLPVIITNCSNNYGPYHHPEKLIPLTILNAVYGKPLPVYGSGSQVRDWLYVDDHARALHKVVSDGKVGETYNIGGHNEKRNIDVVNAICEVLDERLDRRPVDSHKKLIAHVQDRPGHDHRYAIDASKIQRELGWVPQESFESGIRKTVKWYLANLEWCRRARKGGDYQRLGLLSKETA